MASCTDVNTENYQSVEDRIYGRYGWYSYLISVLTIIVGLSGSIFILYRQTIVRLPGYIRVMLGLIILALTLNVIHLVILKIYPGPQEDNPNSV